MFVYACVCVYDTLCVYVSMPHATAPARGRPLTAADRRRPVGGGGWQQLLRTEKLQLQQELGLEEEPEADLTDVGLVQDWGVGRGCQAGLAREGVGWCPAVFWANSLFAPIPIILFTCRINECPPTAISNNHFMKEQHAAQEYYFAA